MKTKVGTVMLFPKMLMTEYDKFDIAIHEMSKEVFKIMNVDRTNGLVSLKASHYKTKEVDSLERYLFPYVSCDGAIYPLCKEWQHDFNFGTLNVEVNFSVSEKDGVKYAVKRQTLKKRRIRLCGKLVELFVDDSQFEVLKEIASNN